MDENEVRRSSSRSGVWAAVAICFIGIILIAGVIAVFGAMNCMPAASGSVRSLLSYLVFV